MPRVSDLFDVTYGHSLELNRLERVGPSEGVAFVSRTSKNNGVSARVRPIPGLAPAPAGALSVVLGTRNYALETNLQLEPFYCGRDIAYLLPKSTMSDTEKLWWAECVKANRFRFNYGRQANRTLSELVLPDEIPDWVPDELPTWSMSTQEAGSELPPTSDWSSFPIPDLFDLHRGRSLTRREMRPGSTPFVSAIMRNNGVSSYIDLPADHPAGCIAVVSNGNGMGWAFYQEKPFVASGDMTVLAPKEALQPGSALFICTMIMADKWRWNYGRKWVYTRLAESSVHLPKGPAGRPDWDFMNAYMSELPLAALALT